MKKKILSIALLVSMIGSLSSCLVNRDHRDRGHRGGGDRDHHDHHYDRYDHR